MTRHSRTASIVCSLATLFILLSPVTGSGYAFDTGTCSEASIEFLTIQIKRAVSIAVNTANILNQDEVPQDITLPIVHMMNEAEPISYIRAVFTGGQVSRQNGQVQQISGIASYTRVLPRFNSKNRGETYPADTQGNMLIYCDASRLGVGSWNRGMNFYNTWDRAARIYFRQPYRACDHGSAAFIIHPATGHADRVTICDWLLKAFVEAWDENGGQGWDTTLTINHMRTLAPADPQPPDGPELLDFIYNRNAALGARELELVEEYRSGQMSDVDLSVGFDTWLIYILTQTRAGGFRNDVNVNEQLPTKAWNTAITPRDEYGTYRSLSYMLAAQVVFMYYQGFVVNFITGNYELIVPPRGNLDFGADQIPVPLPIFTA